MRLIIQFVLTLVMCMFITVSRAEDNRLYFEDYWSYNQADEKGNYNPDEFNFHFMFWDGTYRFDGMGITEKGHYTSSADSIYITITESYILEREGTTLSTKWRQGQKIFYSLVLTNAPVLTGSKYPEEELVLLPTHTNVENDEKSWGSIKLLFKE